MQWLYWYKSCVLINSIQDIGESHHTSEDRFTAVLREWLQSSPNPTWSVLVKALRSPGIDSYEIADEIEDKYIKSDESSVQESKDTAGEWYIPCLLWGQADCVLYVYFAKFRYISIV